MLKKEGKGNKPNASEPLEKDIERLWESGNLGDSDPESLQNIVWFLQTLHTGMRGRDGHYKLQYGDFLVKSITDGVKYTEFNK